MQVCPVKANFECDGLQPAVQVKRVKLNPVTNSLSLKGVKFSCAEPGCREEYSNKTRLADHQRRAHGAKKLKCKDLNCSASFFATPTFRKHMWVKHGIGKQTKRRKGNPVTNCLPLKGMKFSCAEPGCREEFSNKISLANHQRRAHGAKKLKCEEIDCSASFFARRAFRQHMWVKHGIGKGPQCDECGMKVIDVEYLRNHQRAAHRAPKLFCSEPGCSKTFTYNSERYSHIRKYHKQNAH